MNGVDLSLFQFVWDLTWCVFFLNAHGTTDVRYGTRAGHADQSTTHVSIASFKKSMKRALELHRAYPSNAKLFRGKRGPDPEYAVAEKHCIHCHNVREG